MLPGCTPRHRRNPWQQEVATIGAWDGDRPGTNWLHPRPKPVSHHFEFAQNFSEPDELSAELDSALQLAELPPNFDGYGTLPPSLATCQSAVKFVRDHTRFLAEVAHVALPIPSISVGSSGTVEVYWEDPRFDVIVTLEGPAQGSYFARTANKQSRVLEPFTRSLYQRPLIDWLAKHAMSVST